MATQRAGGEVTGAPAWDGPRLAAVALGGIAGAALRGAVVSGAPAGGFPWRVLAVNVAGSVVLGAVMAAGWSHPRARLVLHDGAGIGFCGGLTTFSTFAVEVVERTRAGEPGVAAAYLAVSVAAALAGVVAGAIALRHVRALVMPLEGRP